METRAVSKIVITVLSVPFLLIAEVFRRFHLFRFVDDLNSCVKACESESYKNISDDLFLILVIAEDRRNSIHWGVDPISIVRAAIKFVLFRRIEGASTNEQQFVRVVTGRYKRTIRRKLREQALAIALGKIASKRAIAAAYIHIAFYGKDIDCILRDLSSSVDKLNISKSAELVARLKYPEPTLENRFWRNRLNRRLAYIYRLHEAESTDIRFIHVLNSF